MPPVRTSVVRIVDFRKEEFLDRHQPHSLPAPSAKGRPVLLLLSPDTLQLVTTGDAADGPTAAASMLFSQSRLGSATDKPHRAPTSKPMALLHKLANASTHTSTSGGGAEGASATASAAASEDGSPRGGEVEVLGETLEEGQLLTFAIALSQVSDIECDERRVKILFCRQKPHRSTESNDDWKYVMKGVFFPLLYPVEAAKHKNWGVNAFMGRHRRDPFVGSICLEADSPQEAAALHQAIEAAIARMAQAVQWLSQDLPLDSRPVVTLVTATPAAGAAPAAALASPGRRPGGSGLEEPPVGAAAAAGGGEQIICAFPRFKQPLDVPIPAPATAEGTGSGGSGEDDEASGGSSNGGDDLSVSVWLHSPLGPAVATITTARLQQSADAGGAPVTVVARAHAEDSVTAQSSREKLEVMLQFTATRHAAPAASSSRRLSSRTLSGSPVAAGGGGSLIGLLTSSGGGSSTLAAMLAVLCVPLAAWLQLLVSAGTQATSVLQSVCYLISSITAIVCIVILQLKSPWASPAAAAVAEQAPQAPPPPAGWWRLVLLHADLVHESRSASGAPTVQRLVAPSMLPAPSSAALNMPLDGGGVELPEALRRLVEQHPAVLTEDIAARFLVGLGHADKAYQALNNMVDWIAAQGVADLVRQPQPHFELIKAHYPQVFYSWSTHCDCILEVERTGDWRAAFDALRAQGVSEQELLRHQFFCMEYAFKVLDTRPLPQGKTVKIIDLEGLAMRDVTSAAFKWYLNVGGALLAVNYPQRLHKAFLLNAPTWSGVIWRVLAGFIPRRTREQLVLFTKKEKEAAAEALLQWVPAEQLPVAYGGKCTVPLSQSPLELEMLAYVRQLNSQAQAKEQAQAEEQAQAAPAAAAAAAGGGEALKAGDVLLA